LVLRCFKWVRILRIWRCAWSRDGFASISASACACVTTTKKWTAIERFDGGNLRPCLFNANARACAGACESVLAVVGALESPHSHPFQTARPFSLQPRLSAALRENERPVPQRCANLDQSAIPESEEPMIDICDSENVVTS
jgi:hypothetical protein